jgi:outer membrane protein OmpA-like peptidoglycan-associated protein
MKKQIFLISTAISLFAFASKAQVSIGVNGGYHSLKYSLMDGKSSLKPGFGLDIGFTKPFKNKHWAIVTGIGATYYNTSAALNSSATVTANQVDDMGAGFEYLVTSKNYQEKQQMIGIGVPVYIQLSPGKHQKANWYFNVGPKFILPMEVKVKASAEQLNLQGYYPDVNLLINTEMPVHGFGTVYNWNSNAVKLLKPGLAVSGGTGIRFNLKNGSHLITGFTADYGVTDIKKETAQPLVSYNAPIASGVAATSVLSTTNAGKIIPFSAALQIRYEFGPHKKKAKSKSVGNSVLDYAALDKIINPPLIDGDKDGVPDKSDDCPCVAGPACNKGCPDTNGDGVLDKDDTCPEIKGLKKYEGCPVPDTDKDGINDELDKCPATPGIEKYNGCPVPDTDMDGLSDEEDKCPKTAGPTSNQGCPVIKKEVVKKINFAAENILFETNTATLKNSSFKGLDEVVKIMLDNPAMQLFIDGHTDNVGGIEFNQDLSNRRAASVKEYLVNKGSDETRMYAAGYGETQPVTTNSTPEGRQQNRRVELKLKYE